MTSARSTLQETPRRLLRKAYEGKNCYLRDDHWDNIFSRMKFLSYLRATKINVSAVVFGFLYSLVRPSLVLPGPFADNLKGPGKRSLRMPHYPKNVWGLDIAVYYSINTYFQFSWTVQYLNFQLCVRT